MRGKWVVYLMLAAAFVVSGAVGTARLRGAEPTKAPASLRMWLYETGRTYATYFTVETLEGSTLLEPRTAAPAAAGKKEEIVAALQRALPLADVFRDESFPEVIHIREKALGTEAYAMDKEVSVHFQGDFYGLLKKLIDDSNGTLKEDTHYTTHSARFDGTMKVDIDLKAVPLRTGLCEVLPRWSNPILWTCYAGEREGHMVAFFQAAPSSKLPSAAARKGVDTMPGGR
jgi:hypothetical protein